MSRWIRVRPDTYQDSVRLMRISRELAQMPGVEDAVVVMGTPANRALLNDAGYEGDELEAAGPNDLVLAARGEDLDPEALESELDRLLEASTGAQAGAYRPATLRGALSELPGANLALISVPGEHAAREAFRALRRGLHVMLFSDNVALEDEVALKEEALRRGLLMMGPDCGTALVNGRPLGFANRVRPGPIGIVGASGTGIQEIASTIHRLGGGIRQAIGVGGRDLRGPVQGRMTRLAIRALAADPGTRVLAVVSKPPEPEIARAVVRELTDAGKPAVVQFVGAPERADEDGVRFAGSLAGAARAACRLAGLEVPADAGAVDPGRVADLTRRLPPGATVRGLYCGGTLAQEAVTLLRAEGVTVRSNLGGGSEPPLEGIEPVQGHVIWDLGDDRFTRGRPHPMIEPALRTERLRRELEDPAVGILLFDLVLGFGAHPDPAEELARGLEEARSREPAPVAIASITGTDLDPQGFEKQRRRLLRAGVNLAEDHHSAVRLAAALLEGGAR